MTEAAESTPEEPAKEGEGERMDIHKPKAAHSLGEFAREMGAIICGILIALSLEQVVEVVHRGAEVREARAALRADIGEDMKLLNAQIQEDRCSVRHLSAYAAWAHGGPPPVVIRRNYPVLLTSIWDVSRPSVAAMSLEERSAFGVFYGLAVNFNTLGEHQRAAALRIGEFYGPDTLSATDRAELLKATSNFRNITAATTQNAEGLLKLGRATGAKAAPIPPDVQAQIDAGCKLAAAPPPP